MRTSTMQEFTKSEMVYLLEVYVELCLPVPHFCCLSRDPMLCILFFFFLTTLETGLLDGCKVKVQR